MNFEKMLDGRYAVVTNGGDEMGRAIVKKLCAHGASIAFGVSDSGAGIRLLNDIPMGGQSFYYLTDLSDSHSVENFCMEVKARFPSVDVLINNPSFETNPVSCPLLETTDQDDDGLLQIHQRSVMQTMRAFFPMMKESGGSVVNLSSHAVFKSIKGSPMYTMLKGATGGLTRVGAVEGGPCGIRVNEILSGYREATADTLDTDGIADVALFLASELSSYVTGQSINVDKGLRRALFDNSLRKEDSFAAQ